VQLADKEDPERLVLVLYFGATRQYCWQEARKLLEFEEHRVEKTGAWRRQALPGAAERRRALPGQQGAAALGGCAVACPPCRAAGSKPGCRGAA
jgi:hypothetical protein